MSEKQYYTVTQKVVIWQSKDVKARSAQEALEKATSDGGWEEIEDSNQPLGCFEVFDEDSNIVLTIGDDND